MSTVQLVLQHGGCNFRVVICVCGCKCLCLLAKIEVSRFTQSCHISKALSSFADIPFKGGLHLPLHLLTLLSFLWKWLLILFYIALETVCAVYRRVSGKHLRYFLSQMKLRFHTRLIKRSFWVRKFKKTIPKQFKRALRRVTVHVNWRTTSAILYISCALNTVVDLVVLKLLPRI